MKGGWPVKPELRDYDIFPKVFPAGVAHTATIKPLGAHAAFQPGVEYTLAICPFDEGAPQAWPGRNNVFTRKTKPCGDGCLRFDFAFFGEQQYYIRVNADGKPAVKLSIYSVFEDLAGRYPFLGDLHTHTNRSDGREAPAIVAANYRRAGYDFLAITDHQRYYPSLDAINAYKDTPLEFTLVPGEEIHLPNDANHINDIHIVNFGGEYSINGLAATAQIREAGEDKNRRSLHGACPDKVMPPAEYFALIDAYAETLGIPDHIEKFPYAACHWIFNQIRAANGLGIFAHPCWISNVLQVPPAFTDYMMETHPFDAFEVLGGEPYYAQNGFQTHQYYEDRARGRRYPVVGSSDSHNSTDPAAAHLCATLVFSPANERCALVSSIKDFYSIAVDRNNGRFRLVGDMRLARYACFLLEEFFPLHDPLCFEEGRAMKDHACGDPDARRLLAALHGRMRSQREKYFAF